jgi:hypothetical protein
LKLSLIKKTPLYKTTLEDKIIGIYNCQRPSAAASKAFTTLRRKDPELLKQQIHVHTEGRSACVTYDVSYETVLDSFFGSIKMPVARKSGEKINILNLESKKD